MDNSENTSVLLLDLERLVSHAQRLEGPIIKNILGAAIKSLENEKPYEDIDGLRYEYLRAVYKLLCARHFEILPCKREYYGNGVTTSDGWDASKTDFENITFRQFYEYLESICNSRVYRLGGKRDISFGDVSIHFVSETYINVLVSSINIIDISFTGIKTDNNNFVIDFVKLSPFVNGFAVYASGIEFDLDTKIIDSIDSLSNALGDLMNGYSIIITSAIIDMTRIGNIVNVE